MPDHDLIVKGIGVLGFQQCKCLDAKFMIPLVIQWEFR
jgi:hypothetical protein